MASSQTAAPLVPPPPRPSPHGGTTCGRSTASAADALLTARSLGRRTRRAAACRRCCLASERRPTRSPRRRAPSGEQGEGLRVWARAQAARPCVGHRGKQRRTLGVRGTVGVHTDTRSWTYWLGTPGPAARFMPVRAPRSAIVFGSRVCAWAACRDSEPGMARWPTPGRQGVKNGRTLRAVGEHAKVLCIALRPAARSVFARLAELNV